MSLIKQLWLAIIALLLLSFVGSLTISITTSRDYIEQEVRIKNADNANALALSMSQLDKELVTLELLIAAQFDTGYYRQITLRDTDGSVLIERVSDTYTGDVPVWFRQLVEFDVPSGTATIQDGWRQFGTLELDSQHSFAYASLWRSTLELAAWFLLAGAISLAIATMVVRGIKHPLSRVVAQAQDISARRFTTIEEPRTLELRQVTQAMNILSANVHQMLSHESHKLDELRRHLQHDRVTGALNRDVFMGKLSSQLSSDGARATGMLVMVRVQELETLNEQLGYAGTDQLLVTLVTQLGQLDNVSSEPVVGRLNGSDFIFMLPLVDDVEELRIQVMAALVEVTATVPDVEVYLPTAIVPYAPHDERAILLATLDDALAQAESLTSFEQVVVRQRERVSLYSSHAEWRAALETAIQAGPELAYFPVVDAHGDILHYECPARLQLAGKWHTAGVFIPWVTRFDMEPALDLAVVKKALLTLQTDLKPVGINLSAASITNTQFVNNLRNLLVSQPLLAKQLCFEVPATLSTHAIGSLRGLCAALRPLGCTFGIEHVGAEFTKLADLHDVGLAYLKMDSSLIHQLHASHEQQTIVRGMATLCHSLGIQVIGEGVADDDELVCLFRVGVDGATGPGIHYA
ncbi:bifunctional diguanylate cyclase/phosphodiesterase [Vreelandella maris]|uniref:EAL domain-containing protein n=1 Tax=Vreelandella maris TaxID=2729617 RepID=A0A7Y6RFA3_9GAMM|nr:EAL domain-containing protein [Halomonas maris]NVF15892.1 EAL domain-containing protein [Halomonas maris]|tara:strand:+ start:1089 stop:2993 length:1905 start_codon:yes stop_codon:yes gene_type:complete